MVGTMMRGGHTLVVNLFGGKAVRDFRLETTFWWDPGTGVDPTKPLTMTVTVTVTLAQPLSLSLTLTLPPTLIRAQNRPETGEKHNCAAFGPFHYSAIWGLQYTPEPERENR